MTEAKEPVCILIADDDPDDRLIAGKALARYRLGNEVHFVEDGEELLEYLRREGRYADPAKSPTPGLILLDLNMPRKNGYEALREIKADPRLRRIPVVVLTTSAADEDVLRSYDLGVNSFMTKPVSFQGLAEAMRVLTTYWFELVRRPPQPEEPSSGETAGG